MSPKRIPMIMSLLIVTGLSLPFLAVHATARQEITPYIINHTKDRKKAQKWSEQYYKNWKKSLSPDETSSLKKLLDPVNKIEKNNMDHINHQLQVYGGDLSSRPVDIPEANKILTAHIARIHHAINRPEGRLKKPLIVYKNETVFEVLHIAGRFFREPDHTLNEAKLKQLRENFLYSQHSEFRVYDLFEDINQSATLKWKITLPIGTATGLVDENQIVIDKNSAFKIKQISTIIQKGKQLIQIEADLIPKEIVENKIAQITEKIQKDFNNRLQLPAAKKFLDFKLTGSGSFFIAKKLDRFIDKFITTINFSILKQILQFISMKGEYLFFTDQELFTLPKVYKKEINLETVMLRMNTAGLYNSINGYLAVHLPEGLTHGTEIVPIDLFHEFGHAVDNYAAHLLNKPNSYISTSPEFQKIFAKEGKSLTEYAATDSTEFFAEAFWLLLYPETEDTVKTAAPETYKIMKETLNFIVAHEPHPLTQLQHYKEQSSLVAPSRIS